MLTRDLLQHRTSKGIIRPTFVRPNKIKDLVEIADDFVAIFVASLGETRSALEEQLEQRATGFSRIKIARGLMKLLFDRSVFEESNETIAARRLDSFFTATEVLRTLGDDATLPEYERALDARLGGLDELRGALYGDLAARRKLIEFEALTGAELIDRYNLAQAQGLLIYATELSISSSQPDLRVVRRVLRWLKFCRLVAEVERDGKKWTLNVEGPASILNMAKKYGLQLATFLGAVPLLAQFELRATVKMKNRPPAELLLTELDGLKSTHGKTAGHLPPEIEKVAEMFTDGRWSLDLTPEPRHAGVREVCVPDFTFRDGESDQVICVELFHRWHRHALAKRLDGLEARPDPHLFLGVDRSLAKGDLGPRLENHSQVILFSAFVSPRKLKAVLSRFE